MKNLNEILQLAEQYEHALPPFPAGGTVEEAALERLIDQTLLKADARPGQIEQLCLDARSYHFASAVVNSIFVPLTRKYLAGSSTATCAVVGFPLGAMSNRMKVAETRLCIDEGASEIDMVISIGLLKGSQYGAVLEDIQTVVEAAQSGDALVKVIIETSALTRFEKILTCLFSQAAGAEFVKTSTGFGTGGATVEDVRLMRRVVGPAERMGVKASGGVRTLADARAMIAAGANRLGTSAGIKIIQEARAEVRVA